MTNKLTSVLFGLFIACVSAFGQTTLTQTTTTAAMTNSQNFILLTSATGVVVNTELYVYDPGRELGELVRVRAISGLNATIVRNGQSKAAHVSGANVIVGPTPGTPNAAQAFQAANPFGSCTAASTLFSPWVNASTGQQFTCDTQLGLWLERADSLVYFSPTACTTAPTTLTVTNTYPQIGASNIFVLNSVSNAAAGTMTLVCNLQIPATRGTTGRAAIVKDITVAVGSQVVAPTSIGTATMGLITYPTPVATTQTASVVTPVAAGGTITQLGPTTTVATVTTAGSFLTFRYSPATPFAVSDLQTLQFTVPYVQSAASAMTMNWAGLWVHFVPAAH